MVVLLLRLRLPPPSLNSSLSYTRFARPSYNRPQSRLLATPHRIRPSRSPKEESQSWPPARCCMQLLHGDTRVRPPGTLRSPCHRDITVTLYAFTIHTLCTAAMRAFSSWSKVLLEENLHPLDLSALHAPRHPLARIDCTGDEAVSERGAALAARALARVYNTWMVSSAAGRKRHETERDLR